MNILHILDHSVPLFSGYSFRSQSIVRFQKALGLNPVVVTSPKHGSSEDGVEELDGIRYYRTSANARNLIAQQPFARELQLMAALRRRVAEVAREERTDLIHAHSPLLNGLPALWVGRKLGIPVVYEARAFWEDAAVDHGTFREKSFRYRVSRALETFLFNKADKVVTICESMRKELVDRGIPEENISVVANGVDVEWFQPRNKPLDLARQLAFNGGPVFGFIGSFYHYEGLRFFLDSFPRIAAQSPGAKLLLVGGGGEEALLRSLAKDLGESVIFAGQVPHEGIREFYALMDVLVFPRRRMRLTELVTPLKPLEAMSMAKPVLASDVGGHREIVQHDATGLLFKAENQEEMIYQAVRLARDSTLQVKLGSKARDYVVRERAWDQLVSRYRQVYETLA